VQHASRQGKPLLPAAGKRARELACAGREALQGAIDGVAPGLHAVEPGHEIEVLADRQILPQPGL